MCVVHTARLLYDTVFVIQPIGSVLGSLSCLMQRRGFDPPRRIFPLEGIHTTCLLCDAHYVYQVVTSYHVTVYTCVSNTCGIHTACLLLYTQCCHIYISYHMTWLTFNSTCVSDIHCTYNLSVVWYSLCLSCSNKLKL